jgi:GrpB-like predicted nucleotidyltransferase (UPF0157 family)/GNAT superfamily N-acetyltransferase
VREEPIHLVPYDPTWPRRFEEERAHLARALSPWLEGPIEQIGSTAIPGLTAKPIIDIMAGVRDLTSSLDARAALASLDYVYFPYRSDVMHWFCKPSPARRTHHLHLVPVRSALWVERLIFRDYLRLSPAAAAEYAALKVALAAQHQFDREAYTDAKGAFVRSILDRARGRTDPHREPDALEIEPEALTSPAAAALIAALNVELSARYPEPGATHFRLDPGEVAPGTGVFLVARWFGRPVGCGALRCLREAALVRELGPGAGELKRMYVAPEARRQGIGRALLARLEAEARVLGLARLVLETGTRQAEALALYRRAGFTEISAYGEYAASPATSVCLAKAL